MQETNDCPEVCPDGLWNSDDDVWMYYVHTDAITGVMTRMRKRRRKPRKRRTRAERRQRCFNLLKWIAFIIIFIIIVWGIRELNKYCVRLTKTRESTNAVLAFYCDL